jgi:hypothetical protein
MQAGSLGTHAPLEGRDYVLARARAHGGGVGQVLDIIHHLGCRCMAANYVRRRPETSAAACAACSTACCCMTTVHWRWLTVLLPGASAVLAACHAPS